MRSLEFSTLGPAVNAGVMSAIPSHASPSVPACSSKGIHVTCGGMFEKPVSFLSSIIPASVSPTESLLDVDQRRTAIRLQWGSPDCR